jgi:hypothetical protein
MKTSLTIENIEAGKSYACKFIVREGLASSQRLGVVKTRDSDRELVELVDSESQEVFVVKWSDCWDIDEVEWYDAP